LAVARGAEGAPDGGELGPAGGLVARDGDVVGVDLTQVDPVVAGGRDDLGGPARDPYGEGVEVGAVHDLGAGGAQALGENGRVAVGAPRDGAQALGTVVHGVHAGHHGEQHLGGADVAGGLLAADVLLTGLQRQPVGLVAVRVHGDADEAPWEAAGHLLPD